MITVDDMAQILTRWDNGSMLSVILEDDHSAPLDRVHKIRTEEEAIITLNWLGQHQEAQNALCPRCGALMPGKTTRHALSRYAQITVCDTCGNLESVEVAGLVPKKPLTEWYAVKAVTEDVPTQVDMETQKTVSLSNALLEITENLWSSPEDGTEQELSTLREINRLLGMAVEKAKKMER